MSCIPTSLETLSRRMFFHHVMEILFGIGIFLSIPGLILAFNHPDGSLVGWGLQVLMLVCVWQLHLHRKKYLFLKNHFGQRLRLIKEYWNYDHG